MSRQRPRIAAMAPERWASGSRIAAPSTTRAQTMNGGEKSRRPTLMNR
jgi:hypothetical protein